MAMGNTCCRFVITKSVFVKNLNYYTRLQPFVDFLGGFSFKIINI